MNQSFTLEYDKLVRALIGPVLIIDRSSNSSLNKNSIRCASELTHKAIWDTGATNTVISNALANQMNLIPVSMTSVKTINGTNIAYQYFVDIILTNNVCIKQVLVSGGELDGFDLLIGMDIITLGDFAITNANKKTIFSFHSPSQQFIDFVNQKNIPIRTDKKTGRNNPCPCGSGKKFKQCCGKN